MTRLEDIGFYTLSDHRAANTSATAPLARCELVLTGRCNFRCPYCRHVGGRDIDRDLALRTIDLWAGGGLRAIRFSGGEPTLHPALPDLVDHARSLSVPRIALSTNGSAPLRAYETLLALGVNDVSISLDACCAEDGEKMAGGVKGAWERVIENVRQLSRLTYVTVGVVLTETNEQQATATITLAHALGVADIRIIPAAQRGARLPAIRLSEETLACHPILRYRIGNLRCGATVRGLSDTDSPTCRLALDDIAAMGKRHYPCIIYMREGGNAIGEIGPAVRQERAAWVAAHNSQKDPICRNNCLDVCVAYNNKAAQSRIERI